jgi:hypothetical protein
MEIYARCALIGTLGTTSASHYRRFALVSPLSNTNVPHKNDTRFAEKISRANPKRKISTGTKRGNRDGASGKLMKI